MLVCKFEINWSTNKNLKSAYNISQTDGLTGGRPAFPYPLLRFAGAGDKHNQPTNMNNKCKTSYINHKYV